MVETVCTNFLLQPKLSTASSGQSNRNNRLQIHSGQREAEIRTRSGAPAVPTGTKTQSTHGSQTTKELSSQRRTTLAFPLQVIQRPERSTAQKMSTFNTCATILSDLTWLDCPSKLNRKTCKNPHHTFLHDYMKRMEIGADMCVKCDIGKPKPHTSNLLRHITLTIEYKDLTMNTYAH